MQRHILNKTAREVEFNFSLKVALFRTSSDTSFIVRCKSSWLYRSVRPLANISSPMRGVAPSCWNTVLLTLVAPKVTSISGKNWNQNKNPLLSPASCHHEDHTNYVLAMLQDLWVQSCINPPILCNTYPSYYMPALSNCCLLTILPWLKKWHVACYVITIGPFHAGVVLTKLSNPVFHIQRWFRI
jgi:hypothetical protein